MSLTELTTQVLENIAGEQPSRDLQRELSRRATGASTKELSAATQRLAAALPRLDVERGSWIALTAGTLVELGGAPGALGLALVERLPAVLDAAQRFLNFCLSQVPEEHHADDGIVLGDRCVPESVIDLLIESDPGAVEAWAALTAWCLPLIACGTRDRSIRAAARAADLRRFTAELGAHQDEVACLDRLLRILDGETWLVLDVTSYAGWRIEVSGVADNFQLQTLLADLLPGRHSKPSPATARVAWGEGPQEDRSAVWEKSWEMHAWTAVQAGGGLDQRDLDSRIWSEGMPDEIPCFEGQRVVLLAPVANPLSSWASRYFGDLRPQVRLCAELTRAEVEGLVGRFAK
jgi:hypothetical protein